MFFLLPSLVWSSAGMMMRVMMMIRLLQWFISEEGRGVAMIITCMRLKQPMRFVLFKDFLLHFPFFIKY